MVTYIMKITDSDITPIPRAASKVMSTGTGTDTSFNVAIAKQVYQYIYFFTEPNVPSNDDWEDAGTQTVEIEMDTGDVNILGEVSIARYNSSGVLQDSGAYTAQQTLDVSRTFSPVAPTWGTCACGDRIAIVLRIYNDSHQDRNVDFGVGTTANEVITDITEDSAGCEPPDNVPNQLMMMGAGN